MTIHQNALTAQEYLPFEFFLIAEMFEEAGTIFVREFTPLQVPYQQKMAAKLAQ